MIEILLVGAVHRTREGGRIVCRPGVVIRGVEGQKRVGSHSWRGADMIEHSAKVIGECLDFANKIERNSRQVSNNVLRRPVRIDAMLCRCRNEGHEIQERNRGVDAFRKTGIDALAAS